MEQDLLSLGLTWNEVKVYKSLMKLSETAVGGVINDLKIHRQIAYNALEALEKRGMVEKVVKNNVARFKISDPGVILENIQKQEILAKRLSENIKREMKKNRREKEINIYNGIDGARRYYLKLYREMPADSTAYVIGCTTRRLMEIIGEKVFRGEYTKLKVGRKLYSKLIMSEAFRENQEEFTRGTDPSLREIRYMPFQKLNPITINIWEGRMSFVATGKDVFVIDIVNRDFYDSYKEYFDMLWEIAKE